jgi:heavy metal translocating P-type ATPase
MTQMRLRVTGMNCAGCAATVQRAIEAEPGVSSASVSVIEGLATIQGEDLSSHALARAIEGHGFKAEPLTERLSPSDLRSEIELRQQRQERQWRIRAIVGLSIWAPMEILHWTVSTAWMPWLMMAGATVVMVTAGFGFYRSALAAALRRTTNMDTLIAIGATTAYVFSLVRLLADLGPPLYFTESAALLGIISLGHWLEARSTASAGSAVRELLELQPDVAELCERDGQPTGTTPSADVQPGDLMLIRPGARVPVDGTVIDGESDVDESLVTGESEPVRRGPGDAVVAGSVNAAGRLIVESTVDGRHTTISRIADLVQQAQSSKADIQRLADRVCAVFVPTVLTIAAITMAGWWIAGDPVTGIISTVTVLIISCPCALGLATPMAVMVGAGAASRRGILVKSAVALEAAGRARHVIFDKTGTLTRGRPSVTAIDVEADGWSEQALLGAAADVERASEHPIARAIVDAAEQRDLTRRPVRDFEALPGQGVRGYVDDLVVEVIRDETSTCQVVIDGTRIGTLTVTDDLYPDATAAVERLKGMDLQITVLSGDRRPVAEAIARRLDLDADHVIAEATPESKTQFVADQAAGTVMVGDGINDAAALARADLGIAMASGTNIAIESAAVVIPSNQVTAVPETVRIARATLRTIKQNLFFAFFYNATAIPAAAFGLLGPYGPIIAALAMAGSDLTVIGNALRLRRRLQKEAIT